MHRVVHPNPKVYHLSYIFQFRLGFHVLFGIIPPFLDSKKGFGPSQWWLCLSLPAEFRGRGVFDIGEWFLLTDKSSQISPASGGFDTPCFTSGISRFFVFFGRELAAGFSEFFVGDSPWESPRECHGRLPRGLPAGAQEFQRHHHWGTHAEGPELDNYSWLMLIDRVLIGIVGLFWIINGIVFLCLQQAWFMEDITIYNYSFRNFICFHGRLWT